MSQSTITLIIIACTCILHLTEKFSVAVTTVLGMLAIFVGFCLWQTIIGVTIAWFINVKLLPYPPKPGTLSYWFLKQKDTKI